jgi:hypothetical protein
MPLGLCLCVYPSMFVPYISSPPNIKALGICASTSGGHFNRTNLRWSCLSWLIFVLTAAVTLTLVVYKNFPPLKAVRWVQALKSEFCLISTSKIYHCTDSWRICGVSPHLCAVVRHYQRSRSCFGIDQNGGYHVHSPRSVFPWYSRRRAKFLFLLQALLVPSHYMLFPD